MKGKSCSTHLVNVPKASTSPTNIDPDHFNEHSDPVYVNMVGVKEINRKKASYLILHWCRFQESEELGGKFQVSYCSVES